MQEEKQEQDIHERQTRMRRITQKSKLPLRMDPLLQQPRLQQRPPQTNIRQPKQALHSLLPASEQREHLLQLDLLRPIEHVRILWAPAEQDHVEHPSQQVAHGVAAGPHPDVYAGGLDQRREQRVLGHFRGRNQDAVDKSAIGDGRIWATKQRVAAYGALAVRAEEQVRGHDLAGREGDAGCRAGDGGDIAGEADPHAARNSSCVEDPAKVGAVNDEGGHPELGDEGRVKGKLEQGSEGVSSVRESRAVGVQGEVLGADSMLKDSVQDAEGTQGEAGVGRDLDSRPNLGSDSE